MLSTKSFQSGESKVRRSKAVILDSLQMAKKAGPSTSLRFGRDDKFG
jgi:hypothetical protein